MADRDEQIAIRRAAGQVILGGFTGLELPEPVATELREERLGGVILFRRNIESAGGVAALNRAVHGCRPSDRPPLPLSLDQEGGRVARLRGIATDLPPMAQLGAIGEASLCRRVGAMVGLELRDLGFNLNFAPVADVATEPANPVIGDRAFGTEPHEAARLAGAFALGLRDAGVAACAKHFPGHGDTLLDSHVTLPVLDHSERRLTEIEWVPFASAARLRVPMIMTAHLRVPQLDPTHPATFSPYLLTEVLRGRLGFEGVIVSDDLEMAAVADRYEVARMAELGLRAGLDLFLVCHQHDRQRALYEALVLGAERDSGLRRRLLVSARRVLSFRRKSLTGPKTPPSNGKSVLRRAEHLALAEEVRERFAALGSAEGGVS